VVVEEKHYRRYPGKFLTWHGLGDQNSDLWVIKDRVQDLRYFLLQSSNVPVAQWRWPKKVSDPLIRQGTTPPYALQIAVLAKAKSVSILGVDLSAPDQASKQKNTHFYGTPVQNKTWVCLECDVVVEANKLLRRGGAAICKSCGAKNRLHRLHSSGGGGWSDKHDKFFRPFPAWAKSKGVESFNLSPFTDTPIHKAQWPKLTVEALVSRADGVST
jgi:hypothetical protein